MPPTTDSIDRVASVAPNYAAEENYAMLTILEGAIDNLFNQPLSENTNAEYRPTETANVEPGTTVMDVDPPGPILPSLIPKKTPTVAAQKQSAQMINNSLVILGHHVPDSITYTVCVQIYAYRGKLRSAMSVFHDMLNTPNRERRWDGCPDINYRPLHKTHQALFLLLCQY